MSWTEFDEQLYQALALEERLSADDPGSFARYPEQPDIPCDVSEMVLEKRKTGYFFFMPRASWLADPFNPWYLTLLILWIPTNIIYSGFQLIRFLVTLRFTLMPPIHDKVKIGPDELHLGSRHSWGGSIPYNRISSLGYYANGIRIDYSGKKLLLTTQATWLFIALTHLASSASIKPMLSVPSDFISRCSAERIAVDTGQMKRNPPSSWSAQPTEFHPPIPFWRVVGIAIIAVLIIIIFIS